MFIVILFYFDASAKTQIKLHKNPWIFKQYQGSFYYHIVGVTLNLDLRGQPTLLRAAQKHQIFQAYLDYSYGTASYHDAQVGREQLMFHGFPVIDVNLEPAIGDSALSTDFIIFTDRRNLVMAVNTADSPGSEVRMWYNPDEMENRQRAVFAIGCEILDEELVSAYINAE